MKNIYLNILNYLGKKWMIQILTWNQHHQIFMKINLVVFELCSCWKKCIQIQNLDLRLDDNFRQIRIMSFWQSCCYTRPHPAKVQQEPINVKCHRGFGPWASTRLPPRSLKGLQAVNNHRTNGDVNHRKISTCRHFLWFFVISSNCPEVPGQYQNQGQWRAAEQVPRATGSWPALAVSNNARG